MNEIEAQRNLFVLNLQIERREFANQHGVKLSGIVILHVNTFGEFIEGLWNLIKVQIKREILFDPMNAETPFTWG